jgi:hypothetical protein
MWRSGWLPLDHAAVPHPRHARPRRPQIINILKIRWENVQEAVPAFLTMIAMPMTYSVAYGFIAGIFGWILINGSVFCINFVQVWVCAGDGGGCAARFSHRALSHGAARSPQPCYHGFKPPCQRQQTFSCAGHWAREQHPRTPPPSPRPSWQSYFWPKSEDPTLTRMATWKIARQMTFHLHDDDEEEGSDAGAKMDKPGGSATEEVEPAAAKV